MSDHATQPAEHPGILEESGYSTCSEEKLGICAVEPHGTVASKDQDFWFEDGTIVLVARDVEFRIYKGILAEHSPVFADMFSLPQPSVDCGTGVPVVHLTDSPEDVRHILRALIPKKGTISLQVEPSYHMISAYARLGHKYQIDDLTKTASKFLKDYYTNDYDIWYENHDFQPPGWSRIQAIGVVNMARLLDCPTILPTALSACCTLPATQLLNGTKREDGTTEQLGHEDLARCIDGIRRLTQASSDIYLQFVEPIETPACQSRDACEMGIRTLLRDASLVASIHPFYRNRNLASRIPEEEGSLCQLCEAELERRIRHEHRITWRGFPELMSLTIEGWVTDEEQ